jgi:hypothetical protein
MWMWCGLYISNTLDKLCYTVFMPRFPLRSSSRTSFGHAEWCWIEADDPWIHHASMMRTSLTVLSYLPISEDVRHADSNAHANRKSRSYNRSL